MGTTDKLANRSGGGGGGGRKCVIRNHMELWEGLKLAKEGAGAASDQTEWRGGLHNTHCTHLRFGGDDGDAGRL